MTSNAPTSNAPTSNAPTPRRKPFETVLVANRGEIACRIIRTLRALGIRSVAVYSDADRDALHVSLADAAVRLGPAAPHASYLNIDAILAAAAATGAGAVHPGYGFLSENEAFARACADAGLVFVGPGLTALAVMGDKIRGKNHVAGSGVPVIPGFSRPGQSDAQLVAAAAEVGYPLLIKPSAGGGGKGMLRVDAAGELADALVTARRVAQGSFGDDTLLLERYLDRPRHIEVQVLADASGAVIHLGERECSLQRRHQKVIEEAPSPLLDPATRARIGEAACRAARSVGYTGAGTVEFLVSDMAPDEFFFMEMNTRLQVEHPVTELVTGLDLVEWQLRIAAGESLPLTQAEVVLTGHAIEARVYAENPARGFLPSQGAVLSLSEPVGDGIRVDSSLRPGLTISGVYDPMLAKVIAWGADRAEALARLDRALADTVVLGVHTNVEFLRLLLRNPDVAAGRLDTGLIERSLPGLGLRGMPGQPLPDHFSVAAALFLHAAAGSGTGPWAQPNGWRLGQARPARYSLRVSATETVDVAVLTGPDGLSVAVDDRMPVPARLSPVADHSGTFACELDGRLEVLQLVSDGPRLWLGQNGFSAELVHRSRAERLADRLAGRGRAGGEAGTARPEVRSPMPGTVVAVHLATGDLIVAGQRILTVEAMKMEHHLLAETDGLLTVGVRPGDLVRLDQIVASVDAVAVATTTLTEASAPDTEATPSATPVKGDPT
ncbi:biotin carboxylase N-terminal domain-containing protein [Cryobacterium sp. TMT3-29-2]|uniref:acetyl/propionyl/methylcrotonyl-CoA carboxylase subunit alpha n=1 Tax=Cryobacterium sp. TMT3-29-2 TaxID=2555867 RepID=UPI001073BC90|nr:biotin carboxylase N-terminal domain-containing protein [Cryobacterium sp. TMT3-29-2]TFC93799.1 acetyl/propionyl-CoA carboxylase subunit alpha [Cryobacterium sp. TMT3-29-2]